MCLLFVIKDMEPEHPLIILFNRDEGFQKKTKPLHWWEGEEGKDVICAGRDLDKGGTWAGVTKTGRLGMITFVRKTRENITPEIARGEIVPRWLSSGHDAAEHIAILSREREETLGYNLVFGDTRKQYHYDNHSGLITTLEPGIYGISNAYLNSPWWKVTRGVKALSEEMYYSLDRYFNTTSIWHLERILFSIMEDGTKAPSEEVQDTGLDFFREEKKSSLFVQAEDYGTTSSTIITLNYKGVLRTTERSYNRFGKCHLETTEEFMLEK